MTTIGISSALGQAPVIPIILRTLASNLALHEEKNLPLLPDPSILTTLDVGETEMITSYELEWWSGRKPRDLRKAEILCASTTKKCLVHFRKQKSKPLVLPAGAGAGFTLRKSDTASGTGTLPSTPSVPDHISSPAYDTNTPNSGTGTGCAKCPKYKQLLSDVLQDVLKFQDYASVMSTSSENIFNIGIRKASTFYLLHQAAILKETPDVTVGKGKTSHRISSVTQNAILDENRLAELPESSYKWTWGETLTEDDVLKLRRIGTNPGGVPHSGYDISLPKGKLPGKFSEYEPGPSTHPSIEFEELPNETVFTPPATDLQFPKHFSRPEYRIQYNPYQNSKTSAPSGSTVGSDINPGNIAELWSSGSEKSDIHGNVIQDPVIPPIPGSNDILQPADSWEEDNNVFLPAIVSMEMDSGMVQDSETVQSLADHWVDDEDDPEHKCDENPHLDPEPTLPVSSDIFQMAENWEDDDGLPLASDSKEPEPSLVHEPEDIQSLADHWAENEGDQEHSGDELAPSSYPAGSGAFDVAEQWVSEDEVDELDEDNPPLAKLYGPDDFSFLNDDMFE